jgi:hypothetical protein
MSETNAHNEAPQSGRSILTRNWGKLTKIAQGTKGRLRAVFGTKAERTQQAIDEKKREMEREVNKRKTRPAIDKKRQEMEADMNKRRAGQEAQEANDIDVDTSAELLYNQVKDYDDKTLAALEAVLEGKKVRVRGTRREEIGRDVKRALKNIKLEARMADLDIKELKKALVSQLKAAKTRYEVAQPKIPPAESQRKAS